MIAVKLIARLLDYPQQALADHRHELLAAVEETGFSAARRGQLAGFIDQLAQRELLDAQADYCELFDRGRATSLLLFEHVHGESRERGQAMIDLLQQYRADGLELDARELPDHLPLYLEYLAQGGEARVRPGLQDIAPILALLEARLQQRNSPYAQLMSLLLTLSGSAVDPQHLRQRVAEEARDDTPQALDAVWEEEQVKFIASLGGAEPGCTAASVPPSVGAVLPQYLDLSAPGQARQQE